MRVIDRSNSLKEKEGEEEEEEKEDRHRGTRSRLTKVGESSELLGAFRG